MHDIIIRSGTIVDGSGHPGFVGDVAVTDGVITGVGTVEGRGRREIDARGLIVTPGFVDIHTHYDGQATWDTEIAPTSWHGVTSIVMGNCGVGFAPAAPDKHTFLIDLMEGVEDIPESALAEGLTWDWESFPEYLDAIERRPHTLDIGAQVPHAALRAYVMGERGADADTLASPDDIEAMYRLVRDALQAGAVGFASSRVSIHRARSGAHIGTWKANDDEILGIGRALGDTGRGVFQFASDHRDFEGELRLMRQAAEQFRRPLSFTLLQSLGAPDRWRTVLGFVEQARADGVDMRAQVCLRPVGVLLGLQATLNPFMLTPTYQAIAHLPLAERVVRMRRADVRDAILREHAAIPPTETTAYTAHAIERAFELGDPPNYEPDPSESVVERARRAGRDPVGFVYDLLLQHDGRALLYVPRSNYARFNLDDAREMVLSDATILGLSDGGAHVGTICDASFPTSNLAYWTHDRVRGPRLPLELVVKRQTLDPARHVGWLDRGRIAPGYKADLNVIDLDRLRLHPPEMAFDLPAGGKRLLQRAEGYRFTICSGEVTFEDGHTTGALPGKLVRGAVAAVAIA